MYATGYYIIPASSYADFCLERTCGECYLITEEKVNLYNGEERSEPDA